MRFIVNLGRSTTVLFPGAKPPTAGGGAGAGAGGGWGIAGAKRGRRLPPLKLSFKPVNSFLQNIYQVRMVAGTVHAGLGVGVPAGPCHQHCCAG
jgi:hypothetical protein